MTPQTKKQLWQAVREVDRSLTANHADLETLRYDVLTVLRIVTALLRDMPEEKKPEPWWRRLLRLR